MNKLMLAVLSVGALTAGVAQAADIPARRAAPAAVVAGPACAQFGGVYVGISGGGGYYSSTWNDRDAWLDDLDDNLARANVRQDKFGAVAGGGMGYNWQRGCTVFGVEIDYSWTNLKTRAFETDGEPDALDTATITSKISGFGTARTRAGIVYDNLLLYVTGGAAFAHFKRSASAVDIDTPATETFASNRMRIGWTAGFGTEWAITGNWSLKSEVLYAHFLGDEQTFTCTVFCGPPAEAKRFEHQDSVWISRIGLNYRWGGAPVVARY